MIIVDPEALPDQLHAYRQALGLTRIQLAEIIIEQAPEGEAKTVKGLAAQLWFWETGRRQPLPHQLRPWLAGLGLRLAILPAESEATS